MQQAPVPQTAPTAATTANGTTWGAMGVRRAVSRLVGLAAIALTVTALILLLEALHWAGVVSWTPPPPPQSVTDWWSFGLSISVLVAVGLTIVVLVVFAVVYAVTGALSWRRGTLAMVRSAEEYGPAQVEGARRAREDHSLALWSVVIWVAAGMAAALLAAGVNAVLDVAGRALLSSAATSVATNLAGSIALVGVYYFGSRSLVGLLYGLSAEEGRQRLVRGRRLLLVGALVGIGGAFTPLSWALGAVTVASLALVLLGAYDILQAYDRWIAGRGAAPTPVEGPRPAPA
jgi:hypothetical protein